MFGRLGGMSSAWAGCGGGCGWIRNTFSVRLEQSLETRNAHSGGGGQGRAAPSSSSEKGIEAWESPVVKESNLQARDAAWMVQIGVGGCHSALAYGGDGPNKQRRQ